MVKIARATQTFKNEMYNFFLEAQHSILLDKVHLEYEVYVPGLGMRHLPFKSWMGMNILRDEAEASIEMEVYDQTNLGLGTNEWIEPFFHWMLFDSPHLGLIGAEIGVHRGDNAEKILKYLPIEKLYLIDPYDENPDFQPGNPDLAEAREFAAERLAPWKDKIVWLYNTSEDVLPGLKDLDFAYHDSDHRRACVEKELPLGYAAVARGGYWGGHDYKNTLEGECAVKSCVDEFFIENKLKTLYYSSTMLNWWTVKL